MNTWIAWCLALPALAALSQAMERHHAQAVGTEPSVRAVWCWRAAGVVLLGLSLGVCLHTWGTSVAIAAWLGVLSLAAVAVGLALTYGPQHLRGVAMVCAVLGMVGALRLL